MSLKDELENLRGKARTDENIRMAYEAVVNQLGAPRRRVAPSRSVTSCRAFYCRMQKVAWCFPRSCSGKGPSSSISFAANWCPYCLHTLQALELALPSIEAAGAQLAALTPDTGSHLIATKRRHGLSYEILSDVDGAVGLQFGVLFRAPQSYRELLIGRGIDLEERHGNAGWLIPMPATFVINQSGVIQYAFVNVDFTRRAEPDEIVQVLDGLERADCE